jgi:hypothetical protein
MIADMEKRTYIKKWMLLDVLNTQVEILWHHWCSTFDLPANEMSILLFAIHNKC